MNMTFTRRNFLATGAAATAAGLAPRAFAVPAPGKIWGGLFHMGVNMWSDQPVDSWGPYKGEDLELVCQKDHLRFDEGVWKRLTAHMVEAGMNLVVIDLGEALKYKSHPELAVEGSWEIDRFRAELARLRKMGLEPIPKLNFSTAHDAWLKEYGRMVATPTYYKVCADLVREVIDIFDKPRFFHLGYDEETHGHQRKYLYSVVRQGDIWWHDFLFFVKTVESAGVRPWIWSDFYWHHPQEFMARMPKSVLQSNWYYGDSFALDDANKQRARVQAYIDLDKAGFDQIPTGSNWSNDVNFGKTVEFCEANLSKDRLLGYLTAPWVFTLPKFEAQNLRAIDQVAAARKAING